VAQLFIAFSFEGVCAISLPHLPLILRFPLFLGELPGFQEPAVCRWTLPPCLPPPLPGGSDGVFHSLESKFGSGGVRSASFLSPANVGFVNCSSLPLAVSSTLVGTSPSSLGFVLSRSALPSLVGLDGHSAPVDDSSLSPRRFYLCISFGIG